MKAKIFIIIGILIFLPSTVDLAAARVPEEPLSYVSNEVIIKFKSYVDTESLDPVIHSYLDMETAERVFKSFEKDGRLITAQEKAVQVLAKYPERSGSRLEVQMPDLENILKVKLKDGRDVSSTIKMLKGHLDIAYIEPNYIFKAAGGIPPNDPEYPNQWNLPMVSAEGAWNQFATPEGIGQGVTIAILDTGVSYDQTEMNTQMWLNPEEFPGVDDNGDGIITLNELINHGLEDTNSNGEVTVGDLYGSVFEDGIDNGGNDFVDDFMGWNFGADPWNNDPNDTDGHGSFVAGIAAAATNNNIYMASMSWNSRIMALRGLSAVGMEASNIAPAIVYTANNGADVINMSIVLTTTFFPSQLVEEAVFYAKNLGLIMIAAAGNEGGSVPRFPAGYPDVMAVTATDQMDQPAVFTNYGPWVEVAAPGVDILSLGGIESGTSFAAPLVAGLAGLIVSHHPNLGSGLLRIETVRQMIKTTTDPISSPIDIGMGRINADTALQASPVDVLLARITEPISLFTPMEGTIDIYGIASGGTFDNYAVYYYPDYLTPSDRIQIGSTQFTPVENDILISGWDLTALGVEGFYILELETQDSSGNIALHRQFFHLSTFIRGDANRDSFVNLADAVYTLEYLFNGGTPPPCLDAADSNDDGEINITDSIYTLAALFNGGPLPPDPYPMKGVDPTPDGLGCL